MILHVGEQTLDLSHPVVMTIVNKDKTEEEIQHCRELAQSLGAQLRVREYIPD